MLTLLLISLSTRVHFNIQELLHCKSKCQENHSPCTSPSRELSKETKNEIFWSIPVWWISLIQTKQNKTKQKQTNYLPSLIDFRTCKFVPSEWPTPSPCPKYIVSSTFEVHVPNISSLVPLGASTLKLYYLLEMLKFSTKKLK
jgi:hypothetical protein